MKHHSPSSLKTWRECHLKYHYRHELRLEPKEPDNRLETGRIIHQALAKFYAEQPEARSDTLLGLALGEGRNLSDAGREAAKILFHYWQHYGQDKELPVLMPEMRLKLDYDTFELVNILDGLYFDPSDKAWIVEHKTGRPDIETLIMEDEQVLFYQMVLERIGYKVGGAVYNLLGTNGKFLREWVPRKSDEVQYLYDLTERLDKEIVNDKARDPHPSYWCRPCPYRPICWMRLTGGDPNYVIETEFIKGGS